MTRHPTTRKTTENRTPALRFVVEMVLINQTPLRRTVATDCTTAMARLERARLGWHRFEREDKPAFVRWRAREFGALLSQSRDIEVQLRDAQALVHEVEMEMRRFFQDPYTAYRRVMFRRENAGTASEEPDESESPEPGEARRLTEFEKEALFQEWVQKSLGTNPDKMDDDAYSTTFEAFKSHMFFSAREEPRVRNASRPVPITPQLDEAEEKEPEKKVDDRVKELYRSLVRRLHPDLRADGSATVSALWHEVQEAYGACDVARLEILIALSDIQSSRIGDGTTLSQMHFVLAELNRSWRALEKSLVEAEGEDAWNFARTGPNDDLRLRVQRQLKSDLTARMQRLDLFTRTIAAWAQGPIANRQARPGPSVGRATRCGAVRDDAASSGPAE